MNLAVWWDNFLAYLLQIGCLAGCGAILQYLLRLRHPFVMLAFWQSIFATCLLLPLLQPWRVLAPGTEGIVAGAALEVGVARLLPRAALEMPWREVCLAVLITGVLVRVVWLAIGIVKLRRYRRNATPLCPLPAAVAEIERRVGAPAEILVSKEIDGPASFGARRPTILIPASFSEMTPAQQAAIICHELLHVRRRDWLWGTAEQLVSAALWFHPAIWLLLDRIRLCREQVVDQLVVRTIGSPRPYLESLWQIAMATNRSTGTAATLFSRKRHLTERVTIMVKGVSMSRPRIVGSLALMFLLTLSSGVLAVRSFPLKKVTETSQNAGTRDPELAPERGLALAQEVQPAKVLHKVDPEYPKEAKEKRIQGTVELRITISEKGEVSEVKVVQGHELLREASVSAVKQWRFSPALKEGQPVSVEATMEIEFRLD